jgi:hypothetical protein
MAVTIEFDNLIDGDSIYVPYKVTGKATSDDGADLQGVELHLGPFLVTPLANTNPAHPNTNQSPWWFEFELKEDNTSNGPGSLAVWAYQYGEVYKEPRNFERVN